MPAYPTLDHLPDLSEADMRWAWELDLRAVTDPELGRYYGRTGRYSTTDPFAHRDDVFAFHATGGTGYTVQSGSWFDPYRTVVHDDLGNAIAADDGSGEPGYDYVSFVAPYTGWYYVDASWSQDAYHSYASINVYEERLPIVNTILGSAGHDTLTGTRADDIVDGGAGVDTFMLAGRRDEYDVRRAGGALTVTDLLGHDGTDTLRDVERLSFDGGGWISYETTGFPAEAYRLYRAAFDRVPDQAGLGFWIGAMSGGQSLHGVAEAFVASPEFRSLYGPTPGNADVVTALYHNVLDRAPDAEGFAFWLHALESRTIDLADLLVEFSESPENQVQVLGSLQAGYEFTLA